MNEIVFQLDREPDVATLRKALSGAFMVRFGQVSVITEAEFDRGASWLPEAVPVGAKLSFWSGDFPVEVDIVTSEHVDTRSVLHHVARTLGAVLVTDQMDVNPLSSSDWLMIDPQGGEHVVHGDPEAFADEEHPGIFLLPESRLVYNEHRAPIILAS